MKKVKWLIVDMSTGRFDGHYRDRRRAKEVVRMWKETWPERTFYLVQIAMIEGQVGIPNARFLGHEYRDLLALRRSLKI